MCGYPHTYFTPGTKSPYFKKGMVIIMERDEIIIRNGIVHILDSTIGMPVLSERLLELGPDLNEFLRGHIYKIASSDDISKCEFDKEESIVYGIIKDFNEENLINTSREIANHLYTIMNQNIDIPSADLFVVTYQVNSIISLAILKMNYKESYIHYAYTDEGENYNDIIKQKVTLPTESTKLSEAALINLEDFSIDLVEKKYEINGEKLNYLSTIFLNCHTRLSQKAKLNIITKAVEQVNKKYFEENLDKHMETKAIIHQEYIEQGAIDVETIGEKLYGDIKEVKEEFTEKLEKYNLHEAKVEPQNKQTIKKFEKQFLVTDTGIEINIPMELYTEKKNVEFITNADGTISVLIKNINHITSK